MANPTPDPLPPCPHCNGLGSRQEIDEALITPDPTLSVREGAIKPWASIFRSAENAEEGRYTSGSNWKLPS